MIYASQIRQICKRLNKLFQLTKDNRFFIKNKGIQNRKYAGHTFSTSQKYNSSLPSPQEVTAILRTNEFNKEFTSGSVKLYDSNQLPSNDPIEDTRAEAICTFTSGLLFGVFDGHGGPSCANVISKRMLKYVAAGLLPKERLEQIINEGEYERLINSINDRVDIVSELKQIYDISFKNYLEHLLGSSNDADVMLVLEKSFLALDSHLSDEVTKQYEDTKVINPKTLSVAVSGAVACVTHIHGPHLHVANTGDCNAVLGVMTEDNEWIAKKMTKEHNFDNYDELKRIWSEHPETERSTAIRRGRLLGELAPLRSLGDYRYKWPLDTLKTVAVPLLGQRAVPHNYLTPPYLTAKPDVVYHRLTSKDKFLIIASDGLWDMITPSEAVKLVGEHMKGKVFFYPVKLPQNNVQLGEVNEMLMHRKESLKSKPKDQNAATHLIRHAIGGTDFGIDHSRLAHLLSLSSDVSRLFRDDITVTVVFFDSEFLTQCPA